MPINKTNLDLTNQSNREKFLKLLRSLSHKNIMTYLHLDVLITQKLLMKVQNHVENGTIRDLIYKTVKYILTLRTH